MGKIVKGKRVKFLLEARCGGFRSPERGGGGMIPRNMGGGWEKVFLFVFLFYFIFFKRIID